LAQLVKQQQEHSAEANTHPNKQKVFSYLANRLTDVAQIEPKYAIPGRERAMKMK